MATEVLTKGRISRSLPQALADGGNEGEKLRAGRYGEPYALGLVPTKHLLADEGSYFVATNPTPGTGVAYALQTAFSDTAALFVVKNNASPADPAAPRVYLDHLKLFLTAAPTATVSMEFLVKLDNISRQPTANSATLAPANSNMDSARQAVSQVYAFNAGTATVPASSAAARTVARAHIPTSLGIVGDSYALQFGNVDLGSVPGLTAARATAVAGLVAGAPPVVLGPGQSAVIYMWWLTAATTAPSFEYELGLWER